MRVQDIVGPSADEDMATPAWSGIRLSAEYMLVPPPNGLVARGDSPTLVSPVRFEMRMGQWTSKSLVIPPSVSFRLTAGGRGVEKVGLCALVKRR